MDSRPGKGVSKRFSKRLDEANTARSSLRPTEKILATQRSNSVQIKLDDDLQSLATGVSKLDGPGADKEAVSQQLATVQQQIEQVRGENEELRTFFQEALQEAERLKHENEELRKLGEDAVLDQQLSKALQETDKLKLAADAYKKELLQQKVGELQAELAQTAKRLKVAEEEKSALQGAKGGRRDSFKRLDKQASHQFPNGLAGENAASSASLQTSSGERKDLLARLQGPQQTRGDLDQLLVAAAKVLQDAETLETQLAEARSRNAQLQGEVEKLNDTVFSKTFRAPSAWAEREVKYKMEKKDWDTQVERLQGIINKLTAENVGYRDNNKTQEFEVRIQELQQMLKQTESSKVTAERALHELQLDMRGQIEKYDQLQEARRHQEVLSEEGVTSMIDGFDRQQIGDATSAEPSALQHIQEASPHTHVQEVVSDFDTHHIGVQQPHASPKDEADTHLHNQPAPDVTSQQFAHNLAATQDYAPHTSSSQQLSMQPHASNPGAGHDQSAAQSAQPQAHVSDLLPTHSQQQHNQSGVAVLPKSQAGQLPSSSAIGIPPAEHQLPEVASVSAQEAAGAFQEQGPARHNDPDQVSTSGQSPQQKQLRVDASAEVPSYTQLHPDGAPHTVHSSTNAHQQQAGPSAEPDFPSTVQMQAPPNSAAGMPIVQQEQHAGQSEAAGMPSDHQQHQAGVSAPAQTASSQQVQTSEESASQTSALQAAQHEPGHLDSKQSDATAAAQQRQDPAETASDIQGVNQQQLEANSVTSDAQQGGSLTLEAATSPGVQQEGSETEAEHRGAGFPVGPLDEDDSETSSSEDDLLTVKDAVTHIVRSTRHSRANSSEHLDQLDHKEASPSGRSDPQTAADPLAAVRGVTFSDAGHISLSGASSLPPLTTRRAPGSSKDASEMNGGATTERSESSEAWSEERIRQLEEDKAAIERLWGEHAQENDIGVLKFKLAEFESRCEMYEAQVTKMQRSLERGDDEKAKVEEQLAKAMALTAQGDKQGLAALRDRLSMVVTGRASKTSQLEERLKEAEEQLQQSYRERARLEKQRAKLEQELASWSSKLGVNMDLSRAESLEPSEPSSSDKGERKLQHWKSSGSNIAGLNDGDMEVMRLREENEALMDSLVRTKVELAETEGEYLKTKRSLIRANEKLAGLSEKVDGLKLALNKAGVHNNSDSPSARSDTSTQPFGTPKSVQAGTPRTEAMATVKF
ncbi:TPA: hypothetical protein ACH3X2_011901 [Trebouxia sp. C0005]